MEMVNVMSGGSQPSEYPVVMSRKYEAHVDLLAKMSHSHRHLQPAWWLLYVFCKQPVHSMLALPSLFKASEWERVMVPRASTK